MQGNLFNPPSTGLLSPSKSENRLALALAIQRICRRATAEGKTQVRSATLRKIERQVDQLRKAMG